VTNRGAGRHVLIVEDDAMTALVISEYLAAAGYRISIARTGTEGVHRYVAERPDLALVDVLLPKKDGFDTCYSMKTTEHGHHAPVVLMSAIYRDANQAAEYARDYHADGFWRKPLDLDVLVERVQELIGPP
jgi:DNA-binding response OmpR family regulator